MRKFNFFNVLWRTFLIAACLATIAAAQGKMKPEEIIAKHLESIGKSETIAAVKTRLFQGKSQARKINSAIDTTVNGKGYLVSSSEKLVFQMNFEAMTSADYQREHIGYDGNNFNIPFATESKRSALGDFIFSYKEVVKQGLFGGVLTSNWALLDAKNRVSKFEYKGTEKVGSAETHVLRVVPRGGSGLTIKMFFDTQTFRHLRTIYYQETQPLTTITEEGRVSGIRYKLIEDFSNHKQISGLTLPTSYKIDYTLESPSRLNQYEWKLDLSRFDFNAEVKPELFQ
jgi:hypothetical protein